MKHALADGTIKEYRYGPYKARSQKPDAESLGALLASYQSSPEWNWLAEATKTTRGVYLRDLEKIGHVHAASMRRRDIITIRNAIVEERGMGAGTGFMKAAGALFSWAVENDWMGSSPCYRIKGLPGGHLRAWTEKEAALALDRLPEHLRRAVVLALYSGQRRADLCALTWSAYDGGRLRLSQRKTSTLLVIPCHPALKAELDAWRSQRVETALTILTNRHGQPWAPARLTRQLSTALARAGLGDDLGIHGVRKLSAANLAEAGCTPHQIGAITGHRTLGMVELYTRSADQERLARAAIVRLSRKSDKRKTVPKI